MDWNSIVTTLREYDELYVKQEYNVGTALLPAQFSFIGELSYQNRTENGGWAGEFVKVLFLRAVSDVRRDPEWYDEGYTTTFGEKFGSKSRANQAVRQLKPGIMGHEAEFLTMFVHFGELHVERHLAPGFDCYFKTNLDLIAKTQPAKTRFSAMDLFLSKTVSEHEKFFSNALTPAFGKLEKRWVKLIDGRDVYGWRILFSSFAQGAIYKATAARNAAVQKALLRLLQTKRISLKEFTTLNTRY